MRKIVAPLALIASISLLSSCTKKEESPVVPSVPTQSVTPIQEVQPVEQVDSSKTNESTTDSAVDSSSGAPQTQAPAVKSVVYTRTEIVSYQSPAGKDDVEFSVTVTDGIITSASATPKTTHEVSLNFQNKFALSLSENVVGKSAKDLDIDAIGGASLTTNAFEMFAHSF